MVWSIFEVGEAGGLSRLGRCAVNARWSLVALVVGTEVLEDTGVGLDGNAMVGAFRKLGADRANNAEPKINFGPKRVTLERRINNK